MLQTLFNSLIKMDRLNKYPVEKLPSLFPSQLTEVVALLLQCELELMLVGGVTREYFGFGTLASDVDAEIRPSSSISRGDLKTWQSNLQKFQSLLVERGIKVEDAGVGVLKCDLGEVDLELSTPRTEVFREGEWGHSNFDVHFDPFLSTERAFIRRDFTLNSIGVVIDSLGARLDDPFNGLTDLDQGILRPVSINFHRDPVRILRAIRFKLTLDMNFSEDLEAQLKLANFSELTGHYIALESRKAGVFNFLSLFKDLASEYNWQCPKLLMGLLPLDFKSVRNSRHQDPFELFIILGSLGASEEQMREFALIFGLKHKEIRPAHNLISSLNIKPREREKLSHFNTRWAGPHSNTVLTKLSKSLLQD